MENWQTVFLGLKQLPQELSAFEIEAFFIFSEAERATIETRRRPELQLGLALQIGFLRMSGRLLDALRMVLPALWRHLGAQLSIIPPELASLRALHRRAQTLREHHQIACKALGFAGRASLNGAPYCAPSAKNWRVPATAADYCALLGSGCTSIN